MHIRPPCGDQKSRKFPTGSLIAYGADPQVVLGVLIGTDVGLLEGSFDCEILSQQAFPIGQILFADRQPGAHIRSGWTKPTDNDDGAGRGSRPQGLAVTGAVGVVEQEM